MNLQELKKIAENDELCSSAENEAVVKLITNYEKALGALKDAKKNLGHCVLTGYPQNVRELDGSISQVRHRTIEGKVVDAIEQTLKELGEL